MYNQDLKYTFKKIIVILVLFYSCSSESTIEEKSTTDTIQFEDGFRINYRTNKILDSTSLFKNINNSPILTEKIIANNQSRIDDISFKNIDDSLKITLLRPKYDYVDIVQILSDTLIFISPIYKFSSPYNSIKINLKDTSRSSLFIRNWSIYPVTDSVRTIGIEIGEYVEIFN